MQILLNISLLLRQ